MGCARSRPSCCRPPRKRRHEDPQAAGAGAERRELGPLAGDAGEQRLPPGAREGGAPPGPGRAASPAANAPEQEPREDAPGTARQREEDESQRAPQVQRERRGSRELPGDALDGQQDALRALQASHKQEKEALARAHQKAMKALQETADGLAARLEAVQAQMRRAEEAVSSRDYKQHFQDHGGLSEFWERELESLHFVIEMRNERVHELDRRLALTEAVREKSLALEEKLGSLQQENEDLYARFRQQMAVSRQLSEDLLAARQALEQEKRLRQELQREKEELLFRVLGGQAGPSFPLAPVTPTPTRVSFLAT
ncbi:coiled-coil domain-containing protein 69 [Sorex araneus]|uniref:coiled-coil domain-containing protein 69 n=1 Tax=Sorex araneus TaxID=42254 RepID=UPI002433934B|nr:coiled-coil domain-containing protein 69 [Sorex araneus]